MAQLAGFLAKDLSLVGDRRQVEAVLGAEVTGWLLALVRGAMLAWLHAKAWDVRCRLQASGCRVGKGGWRRRLPAQLSACMCPAECLHVPS